MKKIQSFVKDLPEIYQNIYGYPEYNEESSRHCEERLSCIRKVIESYQAFSGKRELRVLDLGCAQGFYSFSLAETGCLVDGIDFNEQNIALCKALQEENHLPCSFKRDVISTELIDEIEPGTYDVIMIFSVIHHIANEHGFEYARDLITRLAEKSQFVLTELALKEEPLYWNRNLPPKYTEWFENVAFFDEQSFFETHLSDHKRPLVVYSNQFCYLDKCFWAITEYKKSAYEGKQEKPEKKYYLCNDNTVLVKVYREASPFFMEEIHTEHRFLKENSDLDFVPETIAYDENEHRIIEITNVHYGSLLMDMIQQNKELNLVSVFRDIIDECVILEERGLYHNDLRPWNICVDQAGRAFLIDFGATQRDTVDHVVCTMESSGGNAYNHTVFETFVAMIYDCLRGNTYTSIRTAEIYQMSFYYEFDKIPREYANFIKRFLLTNREEVSFRIISDLYHRYVENREKSNLSLEEFIRLQEIQLAGLNMHKEESVRAREREHAMNAKINEIQERVSSVDTIQDIQRQLQEIKGRLDLIDTWWVLRAWRKAADTFRRWKR